MSPDSPPAQQRISVRSSAAVRRLIPIVSVGWVGKATALRTLPRRSRSTATHVCLCNVNTSLAAVRSVLSFAFERASAASSHGPARAASCGIARALVRACRVVFSRVAIFTSCVFVCNLGTGQPLLVGACGLASVQAACAVRYACRMHARSRAAAPAPLAHTSAIHVE